MEPARSGAGRPQSPAPREGAETTKQTSGAFPVVGIGASAGGLQAFRKLLDHLPGDTGMAYVLISHLSPTHESFISELLSRSSKIPIQQVEAGMRVEPNHAYVIRPNTMITIAKGRLVVASRNLSPARQECINHFMISLAREYGPRAIGVVLSGTASDGSRGIEAIKSEGGITFAQDESAEFKEMPRNAVATGAVDFVLPPEGIARELGRISRHPYVVQSHRDSSRDSGPHPEEGELRTIFTLVRGATGVDFGQYKRSTVQRRIARRMAVCKTSDLAGYARYLKDKPKEVQALHDELLIHVTSFFREPDAFEALQTKVYPTLLKNRRPDDTLRVWVPGCSSGEEVYSIAITLLEFLEDNGIQCELQLFGTDVSERAIEKARAGIYDIGVMSDVSPGRQRRFFTHLESGSWQISKAIRDRCVFARQDVIKDPPFSRLDLLSCRNMLIYLGLPLQKQVIPLFHYSLKPNGFMMLGSSESADQFGPLFSPVDKQWKIYSKTPGTQAGSDQFPFRPPFTKTEPGLEKKEDADDSAEFDVGKAADRILAQYTPGILINDKGQVIEYRGEPGLYLRHAPGRPTSNVLKLVREELMVDLDAAVREARQKGMRVRREGLRFMFEERLREIDLDVLPVPAPVGKFFLVLFKQTPIRMAISGGKEPNQGLRKQKKAKQTAGEAERGRAVAELQAKLDASREYQQSLIEKFEATNEELRSASEETLSANEELQSTNEELETAKEELQSSNEELTTLNEELQHRSDALSLLYGDLQNVIVGVNIPMAIVDLGLNIRRVTPQAEKLLGVLPSDVGRRITDFKPKVEVPDLEMMLHSVIDTLAPANVEVRDSEGRWYSVRARPYRAPDNRIDGAVVVFVDITDLKKSMAQVEEARAFLEAVLNTVRDPLLVLDGDLRVRMANRAFYETFQVGQAQTANAPFFELGGGHWNIPRLRDLLENLLQKNTAFKGIEIDHEFERIGRRDMLLHGRRIDSGPDLPTRILLAIEDVTEVKRAAEARLLLAAVVETSPDAIITKTLDGRITSWNKGAEQIFGYTAQEVLGRGIAMLIPADFSEEEQRALEKVRHGELSPPFDTKRRRKDRSLVDVMVTLSHLLGNDGKVVGAAVTARDITERKRAEAEIRHLTESLEHRVQERTAELETAFQHLDTFSYTVSHDLRAPLRAMNAYSQMLIDDYSGKVLDATGQDYARQVAAAAGRMDALVQDLLEYSHISRADLKLEPVDLGSLVSEVLKSMEAELAPRRAQIVVDSGLPSVRGHRGTLHRTLTNLISNAAKFVAPGTQPRIHVSGETREGWVRLWIEDNGIGIPPEHQERIFGIFERLHKQEEYPGTGIGLAIVRKAMERTGGRAGVDSQVGKGSRFWIELPKVERPGTP